MAGKSPRSRPHTFVRDTYCRQHQRTEYSSGQWLRFNGRFWELVQEFEVERELQGIIDADTKLQVQATAPTLRSILKLTRVKLSQPDNAFDSKPDLVSLADCTLEISTRQKRPHNYKDRLTYMFPFPYDPTARSDAWEFYLDRTIPDDCRWFLQEFSGYCMTTDTSHERAVWLYGPSGCGKSTFLDGLRAALGNCVTTFSIGNLDSRFGLPHLKGKTLAISSEQPASIKQAQLLNQLISGEGVMVERKYADPYEEFNHAKFLWAMNELPKIPAGGVGLERRVTVIKFDPIEESRRDESIKRQVKLSGQAIFNWALDGLDRLRARGHFDLPKESAAVIRLAAEKDMKIEVEV